MNLNINIKKYTDHSSPIANKIAILHILSSKCQLQPKTASSDVTSSLIINELNHLGGDNEATVQG